MLNSFLPERVGTQSEEQEPVHATRRGEAGRGGRERERKAKCRGAMGPGLDGQSQT